MFWTYDSMFDHTRVWSLCKLRSVQHCKAGWARPVCSILGKDKRDCICKRLKTNWKFTCKLLYTFGFLVNLGWPPRGRMLSKLFSMHMYIYIYLQFSYSGLLKLKFMLFWALWPAPIRRGSIPDRGHGVKKRCWGRQGNMFLGNSVVFYRKNASPATPVQIEANVSESVCFTNCFYLKRTRLHMDLGLLLFEKNIEYNSVP